MQPDLAEEWAWVRGTNVYLQLCSAADEPDKRFPQEGELQKLGPGGAYTVRSYLPIAVRGVILKVPGRFDEPT